MKRIILSIVGSMLFSLCVVQAQQYDTAGTASKSRSKQQSKQQYEKAEKQRDEKRQKRQASQRDKSQDGSQANEGMVVIEKDEIPASLKETLQQEKYAGWENGTIYHNTNTGEYVIAPRAYRFNEQGEEIDPGDLAYGNRDARQSRYNQRPSIQDDSRGNQAQDQSTRTQDQSALTQDESAQRQDQSGQTQDQASRTEERSYDQSKYNEQLREDRATGDGQQTDDQSTSAREDDPSSQSQDESNAYSSDDGQPAEDAQQPSSSYRGQDDEQSDRASGDQSGQTSENAYRSSEITEDMVEIQAEQIPASLRRTLSQKQFSGWEEEGKLYQDSSTDEYVLVMENSDGASGGRTYRFDKNGNLKDDQNEPGQK